MLVSEGCFYNFRRNFYLIMLNDAYQLKTPYFDHEFLNQFWNDHLCSLLWKENLSWLLICLLYHLMFYNCDMSVSTRKKNVLKEVMEKYARTGFVFWFCSLAEEKLKKKTEVLYDKLIPLKCTYYREKRLFSTVEIFPNKFLLKMNEFIKFKKYLKRKVKWRTFFITKWIK